MRHGMNGPAVFVVVMQLAILFVEVDHGKNLYEIFLRVRDVPQQLIVKGKDALSVRVGVPLVVDADMLVKRLLCFLALAFHVLNLFQNGSVQRLSYDPRDCGPRIDFYGDDLNQRH